MQFRLSRYLLAFLVAFAMLAAACGGDDDGGSSDSQSDSQSGSQSDSASDGASEPADDAGSDAEDSAETEVEPADSETETDTDDAETDTEGDDEVEADAEAEPTDDAAAADPADDGRTIVALDETAATGLLSLGIWPDHVLTTLTQETFAAINTDLGIPTTEFMIAEPSFEVLAGLAPDLIVSIASPFVVEIVDQYEQIAPTVVIPIDVSWQEQLTFLAEGVGSDRAPAVIDAVDAFEADTTAAIAAAGADGTTVSLLTVRIGNVIAADAEGSAGSLIAAAGLSRPEAQQVAGPNGTPFLFLSEEVIGDHDADVLLLAEGVIFDLQPLLDSPVYAGFESVQNDAVQRVVADAWLVGGTGFAAFWALSDMQAIFAEGGSGATLADTADRWAAFLELIG